MKNRIAVFLVVLLTIATAITIVFGMHIFNKKTKIVPEVKDEVMEEEKEEEVTVKHIKDAKIVVFGDEVTYGEGIATNSKNWADTLKERFNLNLINAGVVGDNSTQGLNRLEKDVLSNEPDFVIINFGMNDHYFIENRKENVSLETFKSNLENIVKQVKDKKAIPVLVAPHKVIEGKQGNGNMGGGASYYYKKHPSIWYNEVGSANAQLKKYCDVVKAVAESNEVAYIDMYAESEKYNLNNILRSKVNSNIEDGINLSNEGTKIYSQVIGDYLENNYK